jgi:hypothetical protein
MLGTALIENAILLLIDKVTIEMNDVKCNEMMEMRKNMKKEYHNWFEKWYCRHPVGKTFLSLRQDANTPLEIYR